jgi:site-specific DNA-methyltransferase (adenine-specific)
MEITMTSPKPRNVVAEVIAGDSLSIMGAMKSEIFDAIITDPPFNRGKNYGGFYRDSKSTEEYLSWCESWLFECMRLLKPTGSMYIFNYPENNALLLPFLKRHMHFRRWLTWHYPTNIGHSKKNYTRSQHSILFLTKSEEYKFNREEVSEPYRNPEDRRIKERLSNGSTGRAPYDVFIHNLVKNVSREKTEHPCQIPVKLLSVFIKASTDPGDWILDPFAGSFSTCVAAKQLGRNSVGIEINPNYAALGKRRIAEM